MPYSFNEADARQFYKWLRHELNEFTEVRVIEWVPEGKGKANSFYVTNEDDFVKVCREWNGKRQVYAGINPRCRQSGTAADVKRVTGFPFDIDAPTPNKRRQAATEEELKTAESWMHELVNAIKEIFNVEPYIDFSGNGLRVCLPCDIPVTDQKAIDEKLKLFFAEFEEKLKLPDFDNISDLPRIIKVPGVWSLKGQPTEKRPHRQAFLIQLGDMSKIQEVSDYILSLKPKTETPQTPTTVNAAQVSVNPIKLMNLRPCFVDFISTPSKNRVSTIDKRNDETGMRKALVREMSISGKFTKEEILEVCKKFDDYNYDKSEKEVNTVLNENDSKTWKCESIHEHGGCLGESCRFYASKVTKKPQEETTPATLQEAKEVYKKWLYIGADEEVLDVTLACAIERLIKGDPLWMFLISGSGGTKTEIVRSIVGKTIFTLDSLTPHSLISGKIDKNEEGELVPVVGLLKEIDGKVLIIKDFTVILNKRREDRDEIFSQLRGLYDGYLEFAFGTSPFPIRIYAQIGLIAACTPAIDSYGKLYQQLGERFLKVRHHPDSKKATAKAMRNLGKEEEMRRELSTVTSRLLTSLNVDDLEPITDDQLLAIQETAQSVAFLRTPVLISFWKFEVNEAATPSVEYPTRLAKQLLKLSQCLAVIRGKNKVDDAELNTMRRVAQDTCVPNRIKILKAIVELKTNGHPLEEYNTVTFTTRDIANAAKMPLTTCWRELKELEYLELFSYKKTEEYFSDYAPLKHNPEKDGWALIAPQILNVLVCFTGVPPDDRTKKEESKSIVAANDTKGNTHLGGTDAEQSQVYLVKKPASEESDVVQYSQLVCYFCKKALDGMDWISGDDFTENKPTHQKCYDDQKAMVRAREDYGEPWETS